MEQDDRVMIRKSSLVEHLTCPLCSNIIQDATTVTECLHTFCKDCIYRAFQDVEVHSCPKCHKYLGPSPQRTLRPDHQLQNLKTKLLAYVKPKAASSSTHGKKKGNGKTAKRQRREATLVDQMGDGESKDKASSSSSSVVM